MTRLIFSFQSCVFVQPRLRVWFTTACFVERVLSPGEQDTGRSKGKLSIQAKSSHSMIIVICGRYAFSYNWDILI